MEDNLFIEYVNSPYEEPQDMLPKINEAMLADMGESLEADFKKEYQQEDLASILESIEYIRIYCRNFPCFNGGKSSVSCPLKPSDSAPLKHSTMPP